MRTSASFLILLFVLFFAAPNASAVVFVKGSSLSSSTFRVLDPQHAGFKSSASSDNYRLVSTIGNIAIGSSSATSFGLKSGFLYFPLVIAPAMTSATYGDTDVNLVWTMATMEAGWTLSGYNVCTRPPAGSFACEDVGDVTSFTKTSLTNGTTYTFKVQAKEIFGEVIAESGVITATPAGGGAGGGGGSRYVGKNSVSFIGYAYPGATVTILRDGFLRDSTIAREDGTFDYAESDIVDGTYTYAFWALDTQKRRSVMLSLPLTFIGGTVHNVNNIIIAPTIEFVAADSVLPGEGIGVRGAATPLSRVRIRISPGGQMYTVIATGLNLGTYEFALDTTGLPVGGYDISARTELSPNYFETSQYSQLLPFGIGDPAPELLGTCGNSPDVNLDSRVNLVDFSVLAFWWQRLPLPESRPFDLNCDNRVAIEDFSILAFHWSG